MVRWFCDGKSVVDEDSDAAADSDDPAEGLPVVAVAVDTFCSSPMTVNMAKNVQNIVLSIMYHLLVSILTPNKKQIVD